MKVLKQVFSILMVLIIAFSATACGSESNISQEVTQEESTTQKSIVSEDTTYETLLFDTSFVHTLDVTIADGDWADLLANPTEKTKYKVNVTIDGETVEKVSFATKGNSSLSQVANDPDSNRYSFKINFGKYVDGQTYYGLGWVGQPAIVKWSKQVREQSEMYDAKKEKTGLIFRKIPEVFA